MQVCYHSIRRTKTNDRKGEIFLSDKHKYYIVQETALPEVLIRCVKAKEYLSSGKAKTVNEATALADDPLAPYTGAVHRKHRLHN